MIFGIDATLLAWAWVWGWVAIAAVYIFLKAPQS